MSKKIQNKLLTAVTLFVPTDVEGETSEVKYSKGTIVTDEKHLSMISTVLLGFSEPKKDDTKKEETGNENSNQNAGGNDGDGEKSLEELLKGKLSNEMTSEKILEEAKVEFDLTNNQKKLGATKLAALLEKELSEEQLATLVAYLKA